MIDAAPMYDANLSAIPHPFPGSNRQRLKFWAVPIVWRITGKIIRTALCCIVYYSCVQSQGTFILTWAVLTINLSVSQSINQLISPIVHAKQHELNNNNQNKAQWRATRKANAHLSWSSKMNNELGLLVQVYLCVFPCFMTKVYLS